MKADMNIAKKPIIARGDLNNSMKKKRTEEKDLNLIAPSLFRLDFIASAPNELRMTYPRTNNQFIMILVSIEIISFLGKYILANRGFSMI